MTKSEAIKFFSNSVSRLAEALDIKPQAVSQWPEELSRPISDRVELAMIKAKAIKDTKINS